MDELEAKMAELNLNVHKIRKGFALVIVNKEFKYREDRNGARADRENIMKFCKNAMFTVNDIEGLKLKDTSALKFNHNGDLITDDLTAEEMEKFFKTISKGDFSSYDAFICFISSHGKKGAIVGSDGETIPVEYIVDLFKPNCNGQYRTLVGKPKLFFAQNCRGPLKGEGVSEPGDDGGDDDVESDSGGVRFTVPTEADILVAYATVERYKCYRNKETGSWFILALTQVLNKHAHNMNLTDMLAVINEVVGRMESKKGKKQMSCFTSTLRKAVYFEAFKSSEKHPSPQESEESHVAPLSVGSGESPAAPQESPAAPGETPAAPQESTEAPRGLPAALN
ncbi:caspase-3-like [Paramuricea clavata]|uniref:Caspase-3-like, partial n=1 Tax=Paramuricea clavata TaxID=317549 RepID=A0A6S7JMD7_PARCT|nr:caspase-3-like [Paramuricea clavata]